MDRKLKGLSEAWDYFLTLPTGSDFERNTIAVFDVVVSFGKQDLHPSQFIAWDMENNCPLEMPTGMGCHNPDNPMPDEYMEEYHKYQKAKSRILFEGFEYIGIDKDLDCHSISLHRKLILLFDIEDLSCMTYDINIIQDLAGKVTLTPEVAKKLYGI